MTRPAADRVKATWTGTGTGTMTLGGAASGEPVQGFPATLNGQVVRYLIKHETAQEAEAGYGTYTSATSQLTRTYRTYPTPGGSAVNFSAGTKHVSVTPSHLDFTPNITTVDPTVNDDISTGYLQGHIWINTSGGSVWICRSHTDGAAVWDQINGGGAVDSINGQTGAVVLDGSEIDSTHTPVSYSLPGSPSDDSIDGHLAGIDTLLSTLGGAVSFTEVDDAGNYSVTSFKVGAGGANRNEQRRFTSNDNHLIEFIAANLADGDYGWLIRGGSGTVSLVYNDIPLNGGTSNIGLLSKAKWTVHDGEVLIDGGTNEPVDMESVTVLDVRFKDYSETATSQSGITGALTLDYAAGQKQTVTFGAGNITSVTINNWPPSGEFGTLTVDYVQDGGGARTLADPANTSWFGGAPTYVTTGGTRNRVTYTTENAGTNIYAHYAGAL